MVDRNVVRNSCFHKCVNCSYLNVCCIFLSLDEQRSERLYLRIYGLSQNTARAFCHLFDKLFSVSATG